MEFEEEKTFKQKISRNKRPVDSDSSDSDD